MINKKLIRVQGLNPWSGLGVKPQRGTSMGRKQRRNKDIEFYKNNRYYIKWYRRLKKLSVSRFEWQNLPDTIDERFLEMCLFENGMAVFFKDEVLGFLALKTTIQGMLNVYNIPTRRMAYANNGYQRFLDESDSVIIFNDYLHNTGHEVIEPYAYDLYVANITKNINIQAQKTPVLILTPESQRLTMENIYMQYQGGVPVIYGTEDLDMNRFTVLKTDAPFIAPDLQLLQAQIWNEALTELGIPNMINSTNSRTSTDQVERLQAGSFSSRYSSLAMRQQACEQINKLFGLDIWVEYRMDNDDNLMSPMDVIDFGSGTTAITNKSRGETGGTE